MEASSSPMLRLELAHPQRSEDLLSIPTSPPKITYRLLESARTPMHHELRHRQGSVSTPAGNRPGVKLRPDDAECKRRASPTATALLGHAAEQYAHRLRRDPRRRSRRRRLRCRLHMTVHAPESYGVAGSAFPAGLVGSCPTAESANIARGKALQGGRRRRLVQPECGNGPGQRGHHELAVVRLRP